ncbi:MAG: GNAT family N-acetyltransferase [Bdellovibrionales bacterium]|nr:GNAT family N-acetyltransferase [Bdellovibrionales bacterium]
MKILIQEISFREILPIWEHCLWPSRKSRIEPTSIIDHIGELSLEMERLNPVFFWGGFRGKNNQLVAVLSAFPTSEDHFRCRGLWVHPEVRGTGVGRELILKAEQESLKLGRTILWTMPRMVAPRVLSKMRLYSRQTIVSVRIWSPCFSGEKFSKKLGSVLLFAEHIEFIFSHWELGLGWLLSRSLWRQ